MDRILDDKGDDGVALAIVTATSNKNRMQYKPWRNGNVSGSYKPNDVTLRHTFVNRGTPGGEPEPSDGISSLLGEVFGGVIVI